jgi:hypothetical protein
MEGTNAIRNGLSENSTAVKEPNTMNANYQRCRQQLSRLSFDELLVFDAYGRQHRDPDDIAAALGLSPEKVIAQLQKLSTKLQPIAHMIPWLGVSEGDQLRAAA